MPYVRHRILSHDVPHALSRNAVRHCRCSIVALATENAATAATITITISATTASVVPWQPTKLIVQETLGWGQRNRRVGRALKAFQSPPNNRSSTAAVMAKFASTSARKPAASYPMNAATTAGQVAIVAESNESVPSGIASVAADSPPVDVAMGTGGESGEGTSSPDHSVHTGDAASVSGGRAPGAKAIFAAEGAAASAEGKGGGKQAALSKGKFSTVARVAKHFPNDNGSRSATRPAGDGDAPGDLAEREVDKAQQHEQQELTPIQAAVSAADQKLEGLLNAGRIIRAQSEQEILRGFPRGVPVWVNGDGTTRSGEIGSYGASIGGSDSVGRVDLPGGAVAQEAGGGVMEWAGRFCHIDAGLPPTNSEEDSRLRSALEKHVVHDCDVGLVGTR